MELGLEKGYKSGSGIVYYKIGRNRFEYHPDVLWLDAANSRYKPNAFVWEIESRGCMTKNSFFHTYTFLRDNTFLIFLIVAVTPHTMLIIKISQLSLVISYVLL